jgi:hypothetical protein
MTSNKYKWMIGLSLFFVLSAEQIAKSEDDPFGGGESSVSEHSPVARRSAAAIKPIAESSDSASSFQNGNTPYRCQPRQTGRIGRFKARCRAKYWGYPEEFCEPPLGAMVNAHQEVQIANGMAARTALYQYDFIPDSGQLNSRGKAQLAKIACWLTIDSFPVFVESTPNNVELDELRRQLVWREISSNFMAIPSEQVVVGRPDTRDLGAIDALLLDRNRLGLTASRGVSSSGTSGTSTSTSGATGATGR